MNPISSHLEVELNNRLNFVSLSNSNAVWQAHVDFLINKKMRISANYLIDEFVIDPDIEIGKEHGKAFSIRGVYNLKNSNNNIFSLFSSLIKVGTPTFRHGNGANNFINRDMPLGWAGGSDSYQLQLGANYFNNKDIVSSFEIVQIYEGEENIKNRPYDSYLDYSSGNFPSGGG